MNKDVTANNIAYVTSDPLYAFIALLRTPNQVAPVGVNWSHYASPEVDKLIDEALAQLRPGQAGRAAWPRSTRRWSTTPC